MTVKATTKATGSLTVGSPWDLAVDVRDSKNALTDAVVAVTVTKPDGADVVVAATRESVGRYRAQHILTAPGRYVAAVTAAGLGAVGFTVTSKPVTAALPEDVDAVAYLAALGHSYDLPDVQDALAAEIDAQAAVCKVPAAYPADLRDALLRRVARNLAMRSLPLGIQADAMGSTRIGSTDPEIRRLEGPWRKRNVG